MLRNTNVLLQQSAQICTMHILTFNGARKCARNCNFWTASLKISHHSNIRLELYKLTYVILLV